MSSSKISEFQEMQPQIALLNIEDILHTTIEVIMSDMLLNVLNADEDSKAFAIDRICEIIKDAQELSKNEVMISMETKIKSQIETNHKFKHEIYDLHNSNEFYKQRIEILNSDVNNYIETIHKLEKQYEKSLGGMQNSKVLNEDINKLRELNINLMNENISIKEQVNTINKEKCLQNDLVEPIKNEKNELKTIYETIMKDYEELKTHVASKSEEQRILSNQNQENQQENDELHQEVSKMKESIKEITENNLNVLQKLNLSKKETKKKEDDLLSFRNIVEDLKNKVEKDYAKIVGYEEKVKNLEIENYEVKKKYVQATTSNERFSKDNSEIINKNVMNSIATEKYTEKTGPSKSRSRPKRKHVSNCELNLSTQQSVKSKPGMKSKNNKKHGENLYTFEDNSYKNFSKSYESFEKSEILNLTKNNFNQTGTSFQNSNHSGSLDVSNNQKDDRSESEASIKKARSNNSKSLSVKYKKKKLMDKSTQVDDIKKECEKNEILVNKYINKVDVLKDNYTKLNNQYIDATKSLSNIEKDIFESKKLCKDYEVQISEKDQAIKYNEQDIAYEKSRIKTQENNLYDEREKNIELEGRVDELTFSVENEFKLKKEEIVNKSANIEYFKSELHSLRQKLDQAYAEKDSTINREKIAQMDLRKKLVDLEERSQKDNIQLSSLKKQLEFYKIKVNEKISKSDSKLYKVFNEIILPKLIIEIKKINDIKTDLLIAREEIKSKIVSVEDCITVSIMGASKRWKQDIRNLYGMKGELDFWTEKDLKDREPSSLTILPSRVQCRGVRPSREKYVRANNIYNRSFSRSRSYERSETRSGSIKSRLSGKKLYNTTLSSYKNNTTYELDKKLHNDNLKKALYGNRYTNINNHKNYNIGIQDYINKYDKSYELRVSGQSEDKNQGKNLDKYRYDSNSITKKSKGTSNRKKHVSDGSSVSRSRSPSNDRHKISNSGLPRRELNSMELSSTFKLSDANMTNEFNNKDRKFNYNYEKKINKRDYREISNDYADKENRINNVLIAQVTNYNVNNNESENVTIKDYKMNKHSNGNFLGRERIKTLQSPRRVEPLKFRVYSNSKSNESKKQHQKYSGSRSNSHVRSLDNSVNSKISRNLTEKMNDAVLSHPNTTSRSTKLPIRGFNGIYEDYTQRLSEISLEGGTKRQSTDHQQSSRQSNRFQTFGEKQYIDKIITDNDNHIHVFQRQNNSVSSNQRKSQNKNDYTKEEGDSIQIVKKIRNLNKGLI